MADRVCTDEEFIAAWQRIGSPTGVANHFGLSLRRVYAKRSDIAARLGIDLSSHNAQSPAAIAQRMRTTIRKHEGRIDIDLFDGTVVVFSDAHYYPKTASTAHRALVAMVKKLKPDLVICNGDAFDGATIGRHPRIGWEQKPSVMDELKAVKERLEEVEKAAGRAQLVWTLGNHDLRFESFLSANAPQFADVQGFRLPDHFPAWKFTWAAWLNGDTVVKHRMRSGIHATHNNTVNSGVSIVTGHLHQLKVTPFSDYRGRRYGVDTGTLADPYGPQFIDYTEAGVVNWHSGFVVLTFRGGQMLQPELVAKWDEGVVEFRGELLDADTLKTAVS